MANGLTMPNTREKLIVLTEKINGCCPKEDNCYHCKYEALDDCSVYAKADWLIENGVTVQEDMTQLIGKGLDNIYWRIYGSNKEFNERMAGYNPSSFCAGFQYAIQLAKGLLTQLPQPPKGE